MRKYLIAFLLILITSPCFAFSTAIQAVVSTGAAAAADYVLKDSYATAGDYNNDPFSDANKVYYAAPWVASASYTLRRFKFRAYRSAGAVNTTFTMTIYAASGNEPTGTGLANGTCATTFNVTDMNTSADWVSCDFATGPTITSTNKYFLVLQSNEITDVAIFFVQSSGSGVVSYLVVSPDGTTWTARASNGMNFEAYSYE